MDKLTVKDLIGALKKLPLDAKVRVAVDYSSEQVSSVEYNPIKEEVTIS
jgi:hypothetical protein